MREVDDTLAWNIVVLIVAFFAADVFFAITYLLIAFSVFEGSLHWIVALIIVALVGLFGAMVTMMVFKIRKIIQIVRR
jgi:hypothetical protein